VPWITDGLIESRNLKFVANKILKIQRGGKFEQAKVDDTTNFCLPMREWIETDALKSAGIDRPIMPEPMGSRTTATESGNAMNTAMAFLDEKAAYVAEQWFVWLFEMDMLLWRQYADPNVVVKVTKNNMVLDIAPGSLYGPMSVHVTCVSRYKNTMVNRQELNTLLRNVYPLMAPDMSREERRDLWRWVFGEFKVKDVSRFLRGDNNSQALVETARMQIYMMLEAGKMIDPSPQDDHAAMLAIMEPALRDVRLVPDADPAKVNLLAAHIEARKSMMQQASENIQMAGQSVNAPAQLEGQVTGDMMGAEAGARQ
jgi:hypothetical protein